MSHLDPDTLTLLALGEESDGAGGHLAGCRACSADLASLRRTVEVGREIDRSERPPAPPAHLWDRIADELALAPGPRSAPALGSNGNSPASHATTATPPEPPAPMWSPATRPAPQAPADPPPTAAPSAPPTAAPSAPPTADPSAPPAADPSPPRMVDPAVAAVAPKDGRPPAGPRSRARASKRRRSSLIMGGLVGVAVFAAVAAFGLSSARPRVVAEATLAALEGSSVEGSAQLIERNGALELRVDVDAQDDTDRYYELWLLDTGGDRLVSLGPLTGDGVHPLPAGLTIADFPVVDVSSERFDGDPGHSGDSLSRGTLPV